LPQALQERGANLAEGFVAAMTLGVGQFCTAPGLLFAIGGADLDLFLRKAEELLSQTPPGVMLHAGIKQSFQQGVDRLIQVKGVERVWSSSVEETGCLATPVLLKIPAVTFRNNPELGKEVFGPSSVIVVCDSPKDLLLAARNLEGQLTATVHGCDMELEGYAELFQVLERKAGRILLNGFPTGVEVCDSMSHGGPYPATTDSRTTSVGTAAVKRFLRPVCFQNFPQMMLPGPLKNKNEHYLWRLIDAVLTRNDVSS